MPSLQMIFSLVGQAFVLIFFSVIYIFLVAFVLPGVFLKPKYNESLEGDRGLKKYRFSGGRSIVYEPSPEAKRYIKQYILTSVGDEKYIQCQFDFRVCSCRYEVFAFDTDGRMIDAVWIEEPVSEEQKYISNPAMLPSETAYVRVSVKAVNEVKIDREPVLSIPSSRIAAFTFFTVVLTVAEAFLMKFITVNAAEGIFSYSEFARDYGNLFTLLLAVLTGFVIAKFGKSLHSLGKREKEDLKKARSKKKIR